MKFPSLAIMSTLLSGVFTSPVASPDDYNNCKDYTYDPPKCPHCPYSPSYARSIDTSIFARDDYNNQYCKKPCPDDKKVCKQYGHPDGDGYPQYSAYVERNCYCNNYQYHVVITIEKCSGGYCLVVTYTDDDDRKKYYISVYQDQPSKHDDPDSFNYNSYCSGNRCSVPMNNWPGYPNLCGKTFYIGIDSSGCYNNNKWSPGQGNYVQYISVTVECQGNKVCKEYCCCP